MRLDNALTRKWENFCAYSIFRNESFHRCGFLYYFFCRSCQGLQSSFTSNFTSNFPPLNPRPINLFINYEFFLFIFPHFLAMNSNSSIFVCFSSSKGKMFSSFTSRGAFQFIKLGIFVYLNAIAACTSNASSCKHESHPHSEHKNMTNKHHLREFQVAFLMSLWCAFSFFFLCSIFEF